jgi:hypothetical protein
MSHDHTFHDLEHRLVRALDEHAPRPDSGLAGRLLARTAAVPQRRRASFLSFLDVRTTLLAAAVVVAAIAAGIVFSALPRNVGVGPTPTPSTPPPAPTRSDTPSPTPSASPSPTPATPSPAAERCENETDGYAVAVPDGWWHNERVDGGDLDDVEPCRFFAREAIEIRPATQAAGMAITISTTTGTPPLDGEETTVDGRPAVIRESVNEEGGPFEPAGTRSYGVWIETGGGTHLLVLTSDGPTWSGDYEENVAALREMVDSLRIGP